MIILKDKFRCQVESRKNARKRKAKRLVSNSLYIRKSFQEKFGGTILMPSPVHPEKAPDGALPVVAIGQDFLSQEIWNELIQLDLS